MNICYTQYGHEKELQHTWLQKSKRQHIAALLQQGVSRDRILSDIMQQGNEFTRYYLTAKKDLDNISKSFGISDVQKHLDNQERVRAWVEEWSHSENNPVFFFHKYQGETVPEGYDLRGRRQIDFVHRSRTCSAKLPTPSPPPHCGPTCESANRVSKMPC